MQNCITVAKTYKQIVLGRHRMSNNVATISKEGLSFFSVDVDIFEDTKVRKIFNGCGSGTIDVLLGLLCRIYRFSGYYIAYDSDLSAIIAESIKNEESFVTGVINKALSVDFFSSSLFEKCKILTSKRIQLSYLRVVKLSRISRPDILPAYSLLNSSEEMYRDVADLRNDCTKIRAIKEREKERENSTVSFEQWWGAYGHCPYHDSKERCFELWIGMSSAERSQALAVVRDYVLSSPDVRFRKNPAVYLREKLFLRTVGIARNMTFHRRLSDVDVNESIVYSVPEFIPSRRRVAEE
jgi:hypothetical protein